MSAVFGIMGSLSFPFLRSHMGVEKTGIFGMCALVFSLLLCVASVWLPGSPFDPKFERKVKINPGTVNATNDTMDKELSKDIDAENKSIVSVSFLLTGIILARFGLWVADLSISQVQQEEVVEDKRGVIGGVQNSLNNAFNMAHFFLVILMPDPHMFGILIILSFISIFLGAVSMVMYAAYRGKLLCLIYQTTATTEPDKTEA